MAFNHEVETVFSGSQYKKETNYGTEGTGNATQFVGMNVLPTIVQSKEVNKVQGLAMPTGMKIGEEHSTWEGEGALCTAEMQFFADVISTEPSDPNSFTLYHKEMKSAGCAVSGFSITGDTQTLTGKVSFVGKKVTTGATSTLGNPVMPILFEPQKTKISLNGSELLKVNQWSVDVSGIWDIVNFVDANKQSIAQGEIDGSFSFTMPLDSNAYTYLNNNALNTAVITNTTTIGSSNYTFTIAFDFMFEAPDKPSDTNRVWTIPLKGKIMNKSPKAIEITYTGA